MSTVGYAELVNSMQSITIMFEVNNDIKIKNIFYYRDYPIP
jgi:hypothetical protein